ncbi:MAG: proline dehydrogenase family protein [Candidatus Neomarinimicrobiota bacterium]|nr:proline dehydrogenase family protein [Candidatus Neomarinimicrobiota bacterium]|tara:strand:- start:437 stop:1282 length:846 start_codon:yes stop_codon:yes gene_type:complete
MVHPFAKAYVAGETNEKTVQVVNKMNELGYACTLDILGEHIQSPSKAEKITKDYCNLYEVINKETLNCNISIKLTHIGLELDQKLVENNLQQILRHAKSHNNFLRIDMENSPYTQRTIDLYQKNIHKYDKMGIVLQAYLKRSLEDAQSLNAPGFNTRICKGIYNEPSNIAFKERTEIQDNFFLITKEILSGKGFAAIATHDIPLIDRIESWIEQNNISNDRFEFQVLYGVPMGNRLKRLLSKGYTVRQYIPFGPDWFDYSLRRLKENPKIISYVLANLFKR